MRTPGRKRFLLAAAVVLVGCGDVVAGSGDGGGASGLDAFGTTTWRLESATVEGGALTLPAEHPVTLTVTDGGLGGTSACNQYSGTLQVDGDELRIGEIGGTEMGCLGDGVMELESAYLAALPRVAAARRQGERLLLTGEDVELTFAPVPVEPDAGLTGTTWLLDTLIDGETASSAVAGQQGTLAIGTDGALDGTTGCNAFGGTPRLAGDRLEVDELHVTDMACAGAMDQEAHVLAVVGGGPIVEAEGSRLALTLDDGRGLVYRAGD